jgi:polysaccharide deacetylase 2 family uncharacterized protein YibQ
MASDDLSRPLGLDRTAPASVAPGLPVARIVLGAAGMVAIAAIGWLIARTDPLGGEPHARVKIDRIQAAPANPATQGAEARPPAAQSPDRQRQTAAEAEAGAGVKVTRGQGGGAPGALIIQVPQPPESAGARLAPVDRRLVERGRHGPLPKIAPEVGRPREVYARPVDAAATRGRPLVAVLVTGLGIGATATQEAIARLPGDVSLAFAPYGNELDRQSGAARQDGHEVFLQVPMEPFDYPDNDPGPQTLLAEGAEAQTLDRLHWLMGRMQGYVGLTNFMGAKFTASRSALKPVMEELAKRGLMFVDDGSSVRSQVAPAADAAGLPALRGDTLLDGLDTPGAVDAALEKAEAMARRNGVVIVVGPALPMTVERISRWLAGFNDKGLALVPVTAALGAKRN